MRISPIALLALALLQGCAALKDTPNDNMARVTATVVTERSEDMRKGQPSAMLRADFPAIRGAIFGSPSTASLISTPVVIGAEFSIDIGEWEQRFGPVAQAPADSVLNGVRLEPRATRIARVGTFLYDLDHRQGVAGGVGFKDATTGDYLLLVYFDRPCSMRGVMGAGDDAADIDIQVAKAGMSWLRVVKPGPSSSSKYVISMAPELTKVLLFTQTFPVASRASKQMALAATPLPAQ